MLYYAGFWRDGWICLVFQSEYGLWEEGTFYCWTIGWFLSVYLLGSALFYALLLSVFREEQALSVITHLKSKRQRRKVDK